MLELHEDRLGVELAPEVPVGGGDCRLVDGVVRHPQWCWPSQSLTGLPVICSTLGET